MYYNVCEKISKDEFFAGKKFIESYKKQSAIVADRYVEYFDIIPVENERVIFKNNGKSTKTMTLCRKINYNRNNYIVNLVLKQEPNANYKTISELYITNKGKVNIIDINIIDGMQYDLIYDIKYFFESKRIISPEQAYASRMYTNKALQALIEAHEWDQIAKGIKEMPSLAHSLFIIKEAIDEKENCTVDFGTILYHLISFRQKKLSSFDESDLLRLDMLIQDLRNTELLKVQLHEFTYHEKTWTPNSILLGERDESSRIHISSQLTCDNTELSNEEATLKKCIKHK